MPTRRSVRSRSTVSATCFNTCHHHRCAQAIKIDGLSVAESKILREQAEKHEFQAEVSRMMKLIINSLYKNKEVCPMLFFITFI